MKIITILITSLTIVSCTIIPNENMTRKNKYLPQTTQEIQQRPIIQQVPQPYIVQPKGSGIMTFTIKVEIDRNGKVKVSE